MASAWARTAAAALLRAGAAAAAGRPTWAGAPIRRLPAACKHGGIAVVCAERRQAQGQCGHSKSPYLAGRPPGARCCHWLLRSGQHSAGRPIASPSWCPGPRESTFGRAWGLAGSVIWVAV